MAGLSETPSGPFLNVKNRGLVWIGVPEQCDRCKEIYPMSWIAYDGEHFLCTACEWDVYTEHKDMVIAVSEELDLITGCSTCYKYCDINEMSISYNELICKKCAWKLRLAAIAEEQRVTKVKRQMEIEREKLLPIEERERREIERHKAYYEKITG